MTSRLLALTVAAALFPAFAQTPHLAVPSRATDAAWARAYATNGRDIRLDARFIPLLNASFPQHQWFWRDHNKFLSVPQLVQVFTGVSVLGIAENTAIDEGRYITANGCVPHACGTRGMLWIDTASQPAKLIFVATGNISTSSGDKGASNLFWIFSSSTLNWPQLPQPFLHSLRTWQEALIEQDRKDDLTYQDQFLVANLVQPTGEIVVLTPSVLGIAPPPTPKSSNP